MEASYAGQWIVDGSPMRSGLASASLFSLLSRLSIWRWKRARVVNQESHFIPTEFLNTSLKRLLAATSRSLRWLFFSPFASQAQLTPSKFTGEGFPFVYASISWSEAVQESQARMKLCGQSNHVVIACLLVKQSGAWSNLVCWLENSSPESFLMKMKSRLRLMSESLHSVFLILLTLSCGEAFGAFWDMEMRLSIVGSKSPLYGPLDGFRKHSSCRGN